MSANAFNRTDYSYTPWEKFYSQNGDVTVLCQAHDTLTANTPYKVVKNRYGYITAAATSTAQMFYVGVPDKAYTTSQYFRIQIGGIVSEMVTPSLSITAGYGLIFQTGVVASTGAAYANTPKEFAICLTTSTSSTTQHVKLVPTLHYDLVDMMNTTGDEYAPTAATYTDDTADRKFVSIYCDNGAATGTARTMYLKLYVTGGAGGEALRAYAVCTSDTPADTVNGAHISLGFGTSVGNITGLGTAVRATVMVPARALGTGAVTAVMAELYAATGALAPTGILSLIRLCIDGDGTGITTLTQSANVVAFHFTSGCVNATDGVIDSNRTGTTVGGSVKVYIDGIGMRWMKYYTD
jgi:hypothetical protein